MQRQFEHAKVKTIDFEFLVEESVGFFLQKGTLRMSGQAFSGDAERRRSGIGPEDDPRNGTIWVDGAKREVAQEGHDAEDPHLVLESALHLPRAAPLNGNPDVPLDAGVGLGLVRVAQLVESAVANQPLGEVI